VLRLLDLLHHLLGGSGQPHEELEGPVSVVAGESLAQGSGILLPSGDGFPAHGVRHLPDRDPVERQTSGGGLQRSAPPEEAPKACA
jgi:hypothetical protein